MGNGGVVWAEQKLDSGLAALLISTEPIWIVGLVWLRSGRQRPNLRVIAGMLLGFIGLVMLVRPSGSTNIDLVAAAAVVLASLSWAWGSLYGQRAPLPESPLAATGMQMLGGGTLLAIVSTLTGEPARFALSEVSLKSALSVGYLTVFGAIVAFTAYVWLLRVAPPVLVSTYAYVNPVVAVLLGWAFAGRAADGGHPDLRRRDPGRRGPDHVHPGKKERGHGRGGSQGARSGAHLQGGRSGGVRLALKPLQCPSVLVPARPCPSVFVLLAALGITTFPGRATAASPPPLTWAIENRGLAFSDWRQRIVPGRNGEVWLGGTVSPGVTSGLLYHRPAGESAAWQSVPLSFHAGRTYVLDADPAPADNGLWLCAYSASDEATYGGLTLRHFDGRRWREERVVPGIWPQAMDMVSEREGWIGGNHGNFLHYTAGRWRLETLDLDKKRRQGLNVHALEMRNEREGWAVGAQGLVARYLGGRWRTVPVPPALRSEQLYGLDVTEDGQLWLVGGRGLIAHYDGARWRQWKIPASRDLLGIAMTSSGDGWAVGFQGTILRYDGAAWRPQLSPTAADLYDVRMISPTEGWIAGEGMVLRATTRRLPRLRDVSGLGAYPMARQPGRRVGAVDMDGDGDLDLFSQQVTSVSLYENRGPAGFLEMAALPALPKSPAGPALQGASWGDVEGDGDLDLLLLGSSPPLAWLYRNKGQGNQGRGLFAGPEPFPTGPLGSSNDTAYFLDLDRDGHLDFYLARGSLPGPRLLDNPVYRNDGGGRFRRPPRWQSETGKRGAEMLALWGDLDGDLDLDGVLPGNGNELTLLLNRSERDAGRLEEATAGSGLDVPLGDGQMFQGNLLDLDLDGDLDLLLLGDRLYVFLNASSGNRIRFQRDEDLFEPMENNLAFSSRMSNAGDLDHDGFPEVLLQSVTGDGRPSTRLFSRGPDGRYHDVAPLVGLADLTGNAATFADWDGDGDLDLYVASGARSYLFENHQDDSNYLKLHLHGTRSNRQALGAHVRIYETGHLGEPAFLRGYRQAGMGFNPSGVQDVSELHFGLDGRRRYDVETTFPSGLRRVERGVVPGRTLQIHEDPPGVRSLWLGLRWSRRAWLAANPRLEAVKLGLVLLGLALWSLSSLSSLWSRRGRWGLAIATALLAAYLLAAARLAEETAALPHVYQLLGLAGALGLLTAVDRQVRRFRSSRYLGPYRLQKLLGEGGMGMVYRARHVVTGQTVALKVLHPRIIEREDHRARFLREGRILTRLEHPNIVKVFETGEIDGRGYISMELLDGMPLRQLVRGAHGQGPLPPAAVRDLLRVVCGALAYVHRHGIVHRDVKSDNLFLLTDETGWERRLKLTDFGLARATDMDTVTARRSLLGTLAYMPPEQLRGQGPDARSDLYSLGVVAYEALTGRLPFEADDEGTLLAKIQAGDPAPPRELRPEIPIPLERLVLRMLARSPEERPASAEELEAALAEDLPGSAGIPAGLTNSALDEKTDEKAGKDAGAPRGATPPEPAAVLEAWEKLLRQAQRLLVENRTTEAQVLLVDCLAALEETLRPLNPDQRDLYCQQHDVEAALALMDELNP